MASKLKVMEPKKIEPVKITEDVIKRKLAPRDFYLIVLVNMSTHFVVHYVALTPSIPTDYNSVKWVEIQAIPQTCNTDFQTCINQHRYVPMMTMNCGDQGYCSIAYQDTQTGQWWAGTFRDIIIADCQYVGVAVGLEN